MVLAVVGPGRLGQALARRIFEGGEPLLGFLGRSLQQSNAARNFVGLGKVLDDPAQLAPADVVMISVQDDALAATVQSLAEGCPGERLWFHTSGTHGLDVMAPLRDTGASVASLHPLCPVPDPERGYRNLEGQPAVIEGAAQAAARVSSLAKSAGLDPFVMQELAGESNRQLYHAACVLAANGLTALFALAEELFAAALPGADARRLAAALMSRALQTCAEDGAVAALSGPALRGDAGTLTSQIELLQRRGGAAPIAYAGLMQQAIQMAVERKALDRETSERLLAELRAYPG